MALSAGDRLGRYEIIELLGAGGMGEVYRARDTELERDVAVKLLIEELARDPERVKRFEREARAAAALDHPNILAVHALALEQIEHLLSNPSWVSVPFLEMDPRWDPLRGNPGFQELLERYGSARVDSNDHKPLRKRCRRAPRARWNPGFSQNAQSLRAYSVMGRGVVPITALPGRAVGAGR